MAAKKKQDDDAMVSEFREMLGQLSKQDRKDFIAFCERLIADADAEVAARRLARAPAQSL